MQYKIVYSPEALQDLDDIGDYIAEELSSPNAAFKLLSEIIASIDLLKLHPLMGANISAIADITSDIRFLVVKNYLVFYRFNKNTIYIDRIIYSRRNYLSILFE